MQAGSLAQRNCPVRARFVVVPAALAGPGPILDRCPGWRAQDAARCWRGPWQPAHVPARSVRAGCPPDRLTCPAGMVNPFVPDCAGTAGWHWRAVDRRVRGVLVGGQPASGARLSVSAGQPDGRLGHAARGAGPAQLGIILPGQVILGHISATLGGSPSTFPAH